MKSSRIVKGILICLLTFILLPAAGKRVYAADTISITSTNFPDAKFRAYVKDKFDQNDDNKLSSAEILAVKTIDVRDKEIESLTGVGYFTSLTTLRCYSNAITSLDLSANTALVTLYCASNELTSLDLSANTALKTVDCGFNSLTALNVSGCTALTSLDCSENELTALNLSTNTALKSLNCSENAIASLNVTKNTELTDLNCQENGLTSLNLSKNTALKTLDCSANALTGLNLSANTALTGLDCAENALTTLDLTANTALTSVYCGENSLTSLNVTKCKALLELSCGENSLTSLDLSGNTALTDADVSENQLTSLDLSKNAQLATLDCYDNALTTLKIIKNTKLARLDCESNQLAALDISSSTKLLKAYKNGTAVDGTTYMDYTYGDADEDYELTVDKTTTIVTDTITITTQPKSIAVAVGQTASFTVKALGTNLSYQWYYRTSEEGSWTAVSAASGKTASYSLTAAARHDGYQYRCRIKNGTKTKYSSTVTLTVAAKPVITTQPENVSVAEGKTAAFTAKAEGASLSYQWEYKKPGEDTWTAVSAASGKTASYSFTTAARHNGYQYRLKVSNAAGSVYTNTVTLTVITKPIIVTQPSNVTVAVGKTAKFTAEAQGEDISYQWYYRTSAEGTWTAVSAASGKTASYSLTTAARHNGYQYRLRVKNAAGTVYTKAVTLTVATTPVITTQPANVSVNAGATAKFTVKAVGNSMTYQWFYRKTADSEWAEVSAASGKTASYSLTTAARHNGYQYRCRITNSYGEVYSSTVTLTVQ